MLTAPKREKTQILVPEGTHVARVIGLIHIGTIEDTYMGEAKKFNKIRLTWELPDELHKFKEGEDAKPIVHSQEYTLSMGKKSNLKPIVEGITGALSEEEAYNFNFESLVGSPCLISIKHSKTQKGTIFAKIASTSKLMKGQVCKEAYNQPYKILTYDKWDEALFNSQPEFIKEKIVRSDEYKKMKGIVDKVDPDEIPF